MQWALCFSLLCDDVCVMLGSSLVLFSFCYVMMGREIFIIFVLSQQKHHSVHVVSDALAEGGRLPGL